MAGLRKKTNGGWQLNYRVDGVRHFVTFPAETPRDLLLREKKRVEQMVARHKVKKKMEEISEGLMDGVCDECGGVNPNGHGPYVCHCKGESVMGDLLASRLATLTGTERRMVDLNFDDAVLFDASATFGKTFIPFPTVTICKNAMLTFNKASAVEIMKEIDPNFALVRWSPSNRAILVSFFERTDMPEAARVSQKKTGSYLRIALRSAFLQWDLNRNAVIGRYRLNRMDVGIKDGSVWVVYLDRKCEE